MKTRQFQKGEVIFREWTVGGEMFEIKSGSVGIYANYGADGERLLTELGAGRIFGELSALDLEPRSATAVALSDGEAAEIDFADLRGYLAEQPERVLEIMRGISSRVRELTDDYLDACGTIRELDRCRRESAKQDKSLLGRIKRFLADYNEGQALLAQYGYGAMPDMYGGYYIV